MHKYQAFFWAGFVFNYTACQFQGLCNVEIVRTKEAVMVEVLPGGTRENLNMSE